MTGHIKIQGVIPRIQYIANGDQTEFEFSFVIFKEDNVEVYLNDALQDATAYTVSGIRENTGGKVIFQTPPPNEAVVTISRNLFIERTTDFQEGGTLRADVLNDEFDYQTACLQQVADSINRSMVLPPYASDTDLDLTLPTPSAGRAIVWNADGTNLENSAVKINELESTLKGYKESAESFATIATEKASIASGKADIATEKAQIATNKADEAVATLTNKANKDMDNLSSTGKETLITLAMPDYSSGVSKSKDIIYQAECNGFIWIHGTQNSTNAAALVLKIGYQSDLSDFKDIGKFYSSPNTHLESICFIPIQKGMYYKAADSNGGFEMIFYPAKGEVND